jgi:hypothetical protein
VISSCRKNYLKTFKKRSFEIYLLVHYTAFLVLQQLRPAVGHQWGLITIIEAVHTLRTYGQHIHIEKAKAAKAKDPTLRQPYAVLDNSGIQDKHNYYFGSDEGNEYLSS